MSKQTVEWVVGEFVANIGIRGEAFGDKKSDAAFRKHIIGLIREKLKCTVAAAATLYNSAKKAVGESNPELVLNLGREPGKNNGGPKKKATTVIVEMPVAQIETVAEPERAEIAEVV